MLGAVAPDRGRDGPPPPESSSSGPRGRVNGLAIASLVAGVLWFGWIGSLAAVVMGHMALSQIARSRGTQTGRSAALIGTAFGYFGLTTLLAIILFSAAI